MISTRAIAQALARAERGAFLNDDIWRLVFEQFFIDFNEDDANWSGSTESKTGAAVMRSLQAQRLVSQDFNNIITPFTYERVDLSKNDLTQLTGAVEAPYAGLKKHILSYTKHVQLACMDERELLDATANLMANCSQVEFLRWDGFDGQTAEYAAYTASSYLQAFLKHNQFCYFEQISRSPSYGQISHAPYPTESAQSRKVKVNARFPTPSAALTTPQLKCITVDLCAATFSTLPCRGLFPPMKKLSLLSYQWNHLQTDLEQTWDLTKLRKLSIQYAWTSFLNNAPLDQLTHLESLELSGLHETPTVGHWNGVDIRLLEPAPQRSLDEVLKSLKGLQKFKLIHDGFDDDWRMVVSFDAVLGLGDRLQSLQLRGGRVLHAQGNTAAQSALSTWQLERLLRACPNIRSLDLNIVLTGPAVPTFLVLLAKFESLKKLRLLAGTEDFSTNNPGPRPSHLLLSDDIDYDLANMAMQMLHFHKQGVQFEELQIHCDWFNAGIEGDRTFYSRINEIGEYEQWGTEKGDVPEEDSDM